MKTFSEYILGVVFLNIYEDMNIYKCARVCNFRLRSKTKSNIFFIMLRFYFYFSNFSELIFKGYVQISVTNLHYLPSESI